MKRFLTIITQPAETMEAVRERPQWWLAALGIALLVGVFAAATIQITGPEQLDLMQETRFGEMVPEEDLAEMYARFDEITPAMRVQQGVQGGIGGLLAAFIGALVYFLFGKLSGGRGTFAQVIGVVFWASVVALGYGALVKWPLVVAQGASMSVSLGPAVLFADRGVMDPLFGFLSFFELFSLWGVVLVAIGFVKIHGFAFKKALTVVGSAYLLMSLVMFGIGRLFV
jgi:hypothetical protein